MTGWLLAAFIGAQALDCATTAARLSSGRYQEANPLLPQSPVAICAIKGGVTVGAAIPLWKMRKARPKLTRVLLIVGAGVAGGAAVYNARQGQRRSP